MSQENNSILVVGLAAVAAYLYTSQKSLSAQAADIDDGAAEGPNGSGTPDVPPEEALVDDTTPELEGSFEEEGSRNPDGTLRAMSNPPANIGHAPGGRLPDGWSSTPDGVLHIDLRGQGITATSTATQRKMAIRDTLIELAN